MTKTTEAKTGRGTIIIDGEELETDSAEYGGKTYVIRELTVAESDEVDDAGEGQKPLVAQRLFMRMALEKSIVSVSNGTGDEPRPSLADISKWGGKKYVTLSRVFNRLNTVAEANPTPPGGSPEPT